MEESKNYFYDLIPLDIRGDLANLEEYGECRGKPLEIFEAFVDFYVPGFSKSELAKFPRIYREKLEEELKGEFKKALNVLSDNDIEALKKAQTKQEKKHIIYMACFMNVENEVLRNRSMINHAIILCVLWFFREQMYDTIDDMDKFQGKWTVRYAKQGESINKATTIAASNFSYRQSELNYKLNVLQKKFEEYSETNYNEFKDDNDFVDLPLFGQLPDLSEEEIGSIKSVDDDDYYPHDFDEEAFDNYIYSARISRGVINSDENVIVDIYDEFFADDTKTNGEMQDSINFQQKIMNQLVRTYKSESATINAFRKKLQGLFEKAQNDKESVAKEFLFYYDKVNSVIFKTIQGMR